MLIIKFCAFGAHDILLKIKQYSHDLSANVVKKRSDFAPKKRSGYIG